MSSNEYLLAIGAPAHRTHEIDGQPGVLAAEVLEAIAGPGSQLSQVE